MTSIELKEYQSEAVESLIENGEEQLDDAIADDETKRLLFQAPTGSGKTVVCGEFVREWMDETDHNCSFIWIAPNRLHNQSHVKLKNQLKNSKIKCVSFDELKGTNMIKKNHIIFVNWSSMNRENNTLIIGNERGNSLDNIIENTRKKNQRIISFIDEGHNTAAGIQSKAVRDTINSDLEIFVTATPGNLASQCDETTKIKRKKVIEEGMICESIFFNKDKKTAAATSLEPKDVIANGLAERSRLAKLFKDEQIPGKPAVNPLMLIQLPDKKQHVIGDERDKIEKILKDNHHITTKNGKLAIYLSDDHLKVKETVPWKKVQKRNKKNLDDTNGLPKGKNISDNDSEVEVLIFKQAIALGWDCPRATILCLFRDLENNSFGIQVFGRLMRMPDQKHYKKNTELNHAYVIANFEEIKLDDDLKDLVEQDYTKRRPQLWSNNPIKTPLRRQFVVKQSTRTSLDSVKFGKIFLDANIQKTFKTLKNHTKLAGPKKTILSAQEVKDLAKLQNSISGGTRNIKLTQSQEEQLFEGKIYHLTKGFTPAGSMQAIKEALYTAFSEKPFGFDCLHNPFSDDEEKIQNYVISPTTEKIIEKCIDKAKTIYNQKFVSATTKTISSDIRQWNIPETLPTNRGTEIGTHTCIMTPLVGEIFTTIPEKEFHKKLSSSGKVKWWYKNKDKGSDHFAIPYEESGEKHEFFVDFIVKFSNGKIGLFDTKSGQTLTRDDTKAKAKALADYIKKENKKRKKNEQLIGGIVANTQVPKWTGKFKYNPTGKDTLFDQSKVASNWTDVPL